MIALSLTALGLYLLWLGIFRLSLSPRRYQHLSDRCWGHWWELLLYRDTPHSLLRALSDLLLRTGVLLGWMTLPLLLWMGLAWPVGKWLDSTQSFRPPQPDEAYLVSMKCPQAPKLRCQGPLQLEGTPLLSGSDGQTYWRLKGKGRLVVGCGSQQFDLEVPGKPGASQGPVKVHYPPRQHWLGDIPCPWEVLLILQALIWASMIGVLRRLFL